METLRNSEFKGEGSPYDTNPTEPIYDNNRDSSAADTPDQAQEATPQPTHIPELHDRTDKAFSRVENMFSPTNPDRIQLFDTSYIEQLNEYEALEEKQFTTEELEQMDTENDPLLKKVSDARAKLDRYTVPLHKRFLRGDRTWRKDLKKKRRAAQSAFDEARDEYIESQLPTEDVSSLAYLTFARANLAEATQAARQGDAGSNRKAHAELKEAQAYYDATKETYRDEILATAGTGLSPREKLQLASSFKDHERGALAGEEANIYLTEASDETKKGFFQRQKERYANLSRPKKIVAGVAVAALSGISFGTIGGAMAIGGIAAVKLSRGYLDGESDRLNKSPQTLREKQEASVLHAGNFDDSQAEHAVLSDPDVTSRPELYKAMEQSYAEQHTAANIEESKQISKEKRKVYGKAALYAAIPFLSATAAGILTEAYSHYASHGLFREHGLFGGNHGDNSSNVASPEPEQPEYNTLPPQTTESTGTSPDTIDRPQPESTPAPEPAPTVEATPEQTYLYGDYAGHSIELNIPQGSSIWQQVDADLAARHPFMAFEERERLTANTVNEILRQNTHLDPYNISVGERINANIAA